LSNIVLIIMDFFPIVFWIVAILLNLTNFLINDSNNIIL